MSFVFQIRSAGYLFYLFAVTPDILHSVSITRAFERTPLLYRFISLILYKKITWHSPDHINDSLCVYVEGEGLKDGGNCIKVM